MQKRRVLESMNSNSRATWWGEKYREQPLNKGILVGRARAEMWNSYRAGIYGNTEFRVDELQDKVSKRRKNAVYVALRAVL